MNLKEVFLNLLRGSLIGTAEVIPGVSGGTVALVVGVYNRIIDSAVNFVKGSVALFSSPAKAVTHFRQIDFTLILPLLLGMGFALIVGAALIEPLLHDQPVVMRAVFAGMITASIYVPLKLSGRLGVGTGVLFAIGAVLAFVLTSLPRLEAGSPAIWWVAASAALAVCALVLPGVSGSFLLLSLGMYEPTISAVNDRDFGYLGVFLLGAVLGLASFALVMQYLLSRFPAQTLSLMAGLMLGSLRALWPWQSEAGELIPISDPAATFAWFALGAFLVIFLIGWESRLSRQSH